MTLLKSLPSATTSTHPPQRRACSAAHARMSNADPVVSPRARRRRAGSPADGAAEDRSLELGSGVSIVSQSISNEASSKPRHRCSSCTLGHTRRPTHATAGIGPVRIGPVRIGPVRIGPVRIGLACFALAWLSRSPPPADKIKALHASHAMNVSGGDQCLCLGHVPSRA
jgi:hypothetical protein